jgi:glycosyltransferase involved in cell wall biosynthesis
MKNILTATIITFNEQEDLPRCLESLNELAREVIIVDQGSQDKTVEIAKRYGAKVFTREFDNFANQKNYALSKANGKWILSIDADEVIPSELKEEIKKVLANPDYSGYFIPRRNFILGAEIKHSWWSPDKHIWLWRKGQGEWEGEVHEEVIVKGKVGQLENAKLHYQDKTIKSFIAKNNRYSTILSQKMFEQKEMYSLAKMLKAVFFEFTVRFIYKLGFLDGWRGLVLAILMSYYQYQVWTKLRKLDMEK